MASQSCCTIAPNLSAFFTSDTIAEVREPLRVSPLIFEEKLHITISVPRVSIVAALFHVVSAQTTIEPALAKLSWPQKMHAIVEDPSTDSTVHWSLDGTSFKVTDEKQFAANVYSLHFSRSEPPQPASIRRILYRYGFTVSKDAKDDGAHAYSGAVEFRHTYFQRGRPELLQYVQNIKTALAQDQASDSGDIFELEDDGDEVFSFKSFTVKLRDQAETTRARFTIQDEKVSDCRQGVLQCAAESEGLWHTVIDKAPCPESADIESHHRLPKRPPTPPPPRRKRRVVESSNTASNKRDSKLVARAAAKLSRRRHSNAVEPSTTRRKSTTTFSSCTAGTASISATQRRAEESTEYTTVDHSLETARSNNTSDAKRLNRLSIGSGYYEVEDESDDDDDMYMYERNFRDGSGGALSTTGPVIASPEQATGLHI